MKKKWEMQKKTETSNAKMFLTAGLSLAFALAISINALAQTPAIQVDGDLLPIMGGQDPVIIDGRTLVPLRAVMEPLGYHVAWDDNTRQATLTKAPHTIIVRIDDAGLNVNGERRLLDVPARVINNRTMVPLRAISEATGYTVVWDSNTYTANILTAPAQPDAPPSIPSNEQNDKDKAADTFERRVFELTNAERVSHGLHPLIWDDTLAKVARFYSVDSAEHNIVGHVGSDGSTVSQRVMREGITYETIGENFAFGAESPELAFENWMLSPGHRANILNADFTHIGVGFHELSGSQWRFYCTQLFGSGI